MKSLMTLLLMSASIIANAQNWSVGVAGGTSLWKNISGDSYHNGATGVRGWDAEAQVRRETKGSWSYSLALNYGSYNTSQSMADVVYFVQPEHNFTSVQDRNQVISARIGANYSFFKNCKSACPLMNKVSFEAGAFLAPAMGMTNSRLYYNDNGSEQFKSDKSDNRFGMSAGVQMRVAYKINDRFAATVTSATQYDFTNHLSICPKVTGLGTDLRCSALVGMSYNLK